MPELSITETQQEQLEAVREEVEAAFVDTYGHARTQDALDYLLDTYTPPTESGDSGAYDRIASAEYPELQRIASTVEDIPGSGINADEMRGKLLKTLGPAELARRLGDADEAETTATSDDQRTAEPVGTGTSDRSDDGPDDADESATGGETAETDKSGTDEKSATGDESGNTDEESGSDGAATGADGPGGVLAAANRLLREHDEKWRKSETSEEPYEVDLPDGTTTGVRTKDDVRQLLFKHY